MPIVHCGFEACKFRVDEYCCKSDLQEVELVYGKKETDEGDIEFLICRAFEWPEVKRCFG